MKMIVLFLLLFMATSCSENKPKVKGSYHYTTNYFSTDHRSQFEKHLQRFKGQPNVKYLELGAYEGRSFFWMLENILTHKSTKAYAVDIFFDSIEGIFNKNLKASGLSKKVVVKKGYFNEILPKLKSKTFDIIYLDGGHQAWTTLETVILSWRLLKPGGVFIFDDYKWRVGVYPSELRPQAAIDGFLYSFKDYLKVLHKNKVVVLEKLNNGCRSLCKSKICSPLKEHLYCWQSKKVLDLKGDEFVIKDSQRKQLESFFLKRKSDQFERPSLSEVISLESF